MLIDDAVVFVEAGEDDAAGARTGMSQIQGFGDVFEVSRPQHTRVFLSLEFTFLACDFFTVFQIFVHVFERVRCPGHGGFLSVRG